MLPLSFYKELLEDPFLFQTSKTRLNKIQIYYRNKIYAVVTPV